MEIKIFVFLRKTCRFPRKETSTFVQIERDFRRIYRYTDSDSIVSTLQYSEIDHFAVYGSEAKMQSISEKIVKRSKIIIY